MSVTICASFFQKSANTDGKFGILGALAGIGEFLRLHGAIIFGILGALSIHRPMWKITVFLGILGAGFAGLFGILGANLRHSGGYITCMSCTSFL